MNKSNMNAVVFTLAPGRKKLPWINESIAEESEVFRETGITGYWCATRKITHIAIATNNNTVLIGEFMRCETHPENKQRWKFYCTNIKECVCPWNTKTQNPVQYAHYDEETNQISI